MAQKKKSTPTRRRKATKKRVRAPKKVTAKAPVAKEAEVSEVFSGSAKVIQAELRDDIFGVKVRPHLLHEMVCMQRQSGRRGTASTKTKGLVRGGGKKPWRQKGTGRARVGSIRSPIWVGGGTIFGPQPRDYSYRLPKKARREALCSALSLKRRDGRLVVVDKVELSHPKTKAMVGLLGDLKLKSALIVIPQDDPTVELAARNLSTVKVLKTDGLNVYDVLRYEHLVITEEALRAIEARLAA